MPKTTIFTLLAVGLAVGFVLFYRSAEASSKAVPQTERQAKKQEKKQQKKETEKQDEKPQEAVLARFMRKKLDASNKVLKGLMTDDFEDIEKGADALLAMSMQERWRVSADPTYGRFSREYRSAVRKLQAKSKKETTDGAALAWIDVTMSCIECHDWVRNIVVADHELPPR